MYRVTHGLTSTYLTDLCEQCSNIRLRNLCFTWRLHFTSFASALCWQFIPCINTTAWNNLPAHIRSCTSLSQFL